MCLILLGRIQHKNSTLNIKIKEELKVLKSSDQGSNFNKQKNLKYMQTFDSKRSQLVVKVCILQVFTKSTFTKSRKCQ